MSGRISPGSDVVVVLNYRGTADTLGCVESLRSGSPEAVVVVVDNGSSDDVLDQVAARWPGVLTVRTGRNLGFAGGMNVGLEKALAEGAATVTLLNNDTTLPLGAIGALAASAGSGGLVSPEIRYADSEEVWFGGGTIDQETNLARHLNETELRHAPRGLHPTEMLAGCCLTATAETWRRLGLLDDRYFLIFEDSELSVRAATRGVPLLVDPQVVIRHRVSGSFTGPYRWLGLYYYTRNGLLFGRRCLGGSLLQAARFLRRHVLGAALGPLRRGRVREASRAVLVMAYAVWHHVIDRRGRAPRSLEWLAARWSA